MRLFWRLIRLKQNRSEKFITEIEIENKTLREPSDISTAFSNYYSKVLTPKTLPTYNTAYHARLKDTVNEFLNSNDYSEDDILTSEVGFIELVDIVKHLNKWKAPGHDKIVNGHLIHGGEVLIKYLQKLFTMILNVPCILNNCK